MSSKRPHPEANDAVAEARALAAAKFAKMTKDHKSPRGSSPQLIAASSPNQARMSQSVPSNNAITANAVPKVLDFRKRIEKAKAQALAKKAEQTASAAQIMSSLKVGGNRDHKGGLVFGIHPKLQEDSQVSSGQFSGASRFATTLGNRKQKAADSKSVPAAKQLQLLDGPDESFTNREMNPYFDPSLGGKDTSRPMNRKSRAFQFNVPGEHIERANKKREEERLRKLQIQIAENARKAGLEDDLNASSLAAREEPPDCEYWDLPYAIDDARKDIVAFTRRLIEPGGPITNMIQHPIKLQSPANLGAPISVPLKLTQKEHKRIRRQNRAAALKDKQDKQRLGLIEADPPKVKLSNLRTVLASTSVQNPTQVEQEVRHQVQARKDKHEQMNQERKLSVEEKREKALQKLAEDEAKGIRASAWRIETLDNRYLRKRIEDNAAQCGLSGIMVHNPRFNLVYAEGGAKGLKFFKKLMEQRIDWTEPPQSLSTNQSAAATMEVVLPDFESNKCVCTWEGIREKRLYTTGFQYRRCENELRVKELVKAEIYSLWKIAKNKTED